MSSIDQIKRHNEHKVHAYWREFNASGDEIYTALPYQNIFQCDTLADKLNIFKKGMYHIDFDEKKKDLTHRVGVYFQKEIDYIFENRKILREEPSEVSLSKFKLFRDMKKNNETLYTNFKTKLSQTLIKIAQEGTFCVKDIKEIIAEVIASSLTNGFIIL